MYINEKLGDTASDLEADFRRRVAESNQSMNQSDRAVQSVARTIQAVTILHALAWVGGVGILGYWLLRKK